MFRRYFCCSWIFSEFEKLSGRPTSGFSRWRSRLLNRCVRLIGTSTFAKNRTYTSILRQIWKITVTIPGKFLSTPKLPLHTVFDYLRSYEVFSCNNFNIYSYHGTTRLITARTFIYYPTPRHLHELHTPPGIKIHCFFPRGCIWQYYWRGHWRHW